LRSFISMFTVSPEYNAKFINDLDCLCLSACESVVDSGLEVEYLGGV